MLARSKRARCAMPWTPLPTKSTKPPECNKGGGSTADAKSARTLRRQPSGKEEHEKILIPLRQALRAVTTTSARAHVEKAEELDAMNRRAQRGAARKRKHMAEVTEATESDLSFLEMNRVQTRTAHSYCKEVAAFDRWVSEQKQSTDTPAKFDRALLEYLDSMFFEGWNHERGDRLISSLAFLLPHAHRGGKWDPHRARRALRGFRRLAPGRSRVPLPWLAAAAMIGAALHLKLDEFALALLISWVGHLRLPSDLVAMTHKSLVKPSRFAHTKFWGLLLYPEEDVATSKAGLKDEGLMLDFEPLTKLSPLLTKLQRSRAAAPHLWTFTAMEFRRLFAKCAEGAGLRGQSLHPYQFRHGSASHNVLTGKHTIEEIQARLRHEAPNSTKRYEKHTRYLTEVNKLPRDVKIFGEWVSTHLADCFLRKAALRKPPGLSATLRGEGKAQVQKLHRDIP